LQLKFKSSSSSSDRKAVVDKLTSRGARKVSPLFPGSTDEYLQTLYMVEADDQAKLLPFLEHEPAVELVEPAVRRRLASS
jgi:hypothetical protein